MQPICTHKIGSHSSKPSHAYPVIRLPREYKSLAGRTAHVYQTQNNGKLAFLITIDEEVGNLVATNKVDNRISKLESKIDTILQFLKANNPKKLLNKKTKGRGRDSNPRRGLHRAIGLPGYPTSANI